MSLDEKVHFYNVESGDRRSAEHHVTLSVAVVELQLSRRVTNYSVARRLLCTLLCYVNVCTVIERYRVRVTWDYSIRTRIVSYLAGEHELCVHQRAAVC